VTCKGRFGEIKAAVTQLQSGRRCQHRGPHRSCPAFLSPQALAPQLHSHMPGSDTSHGSCTVYPTPGHCTGASPLEEAMLLLAPRSMGLVGALDAQQRHW
jgi:hypothetical protein